MFNLIKIFMQLGYKYADLLDDDVFKLVFGQESSKDVTIEFLNQVITDRNIVDLVRRLRHLRLRYDRHRLDLRRCQFLRRIIENDVPFYTRYADGEKLQAKV